MQKSLQGKHVGADAAVRVAEAEQHSVCLVQAESEEEPQNISVALTEACFSLGIIYKTDLCFTCKSVVHKVTVLF